MRFDVITLFPELVDSIASSGVIGRGFQQGLLQLKCWNPREYATDRHRTVDDRPYGGGPGMVMKIEPLKAAIRAAKAATEGVSKVVYLSPQGRRIDQDAVREFASRGSLILVAGRYEGIDERLIETEIDEEWSIGDYVISGGELAAMVVIDAVSRLVPGVLGDDQSAQLDSYMNGLLDCPHYTRPENYEGMQVPEVLLGGNHAEIERWRLKQSLGRTWQRRPDLLEKVSLSEEQRLLIEEFKREWSENG